MHKKIGKAFLITGSLITHGICCAGDAVPQLPDKVTTASVEKSATDGMTISPKSSTENVIAPQLPDKVTMIPLEKSATEGVTISPKSTTENVIAPQLPGKVTTASLEKSTTEGVTISPKSTIENVIAPQLPDKVTTTSVEKSAAEADAKCIKCTKLIETIESLHQSLQENIRSLVDPCTVACHLNKKLAEKYFALQHDYLQKTIERHFYKIMTFTTSCIACSLIIAMQWTKINAFIKQSYAYIKKLCKKIANINSALKKITRTKMKMYNKKFITFLAISICIALHASENIPVPPLLLEYDSDTLFAYLVVDELAKKDANVCKEERSWIIGGAKRADGINGRIIITAGSTRDGIIKVVQDARAQAFAIERFISDPEKFKTQENPALYTMLCYYQNKGTLQNYKNICTRNLPMLIDAVDKATHILDNEHTSLQLPSSYVSDRLSFLYFHALNFKNLRSIDNYQELRMLDPKLHHKLSNTPELDTLIERLHQELDPLW